ncbi:MAG: hypothetical protein KKA32_11705 [Actinobacteria bacterium]|nr:hypothetical protein [Actinomycetota bacterium]
MTITRGHCAVGEFGPFDERDQIRDTPGLGRVGVNSGRIAGEEAVRYARSLKG